MVVRGLEGGDAAQGDGAEDEDHAQAQENGGRQEDVHGGLW